MSPRQQFNLVAMAKAGEFPVAWCVVEYTLIDPTGQQEAVSMMVVATKLRDAFTLADCNRNSEWRKHVTPDHPVQITITLIADRATCQKEANKIVMSRNPRPRCNVFGYNSFSIARPLLCNNDQVYENQAEAARLLNISQSALSRHLKGELRHVKGYIFAYKD